MEMRNLAAIAVAATSAILPMVSNAAVAEVGAAAYHVVSPVAVTAQGVFNSRSAIYAIDGSGMSPAKVSDVHAATASASMASDYGMWLSANTKGTWIAFDLGKEREVAGFHLWNYNELENGSNHRKWNDHGIRTAGVYVGAAMPTNGTAYADAGATWGTLVKDMEFEKAPSSADYTGEDYFFDAPVRGRYFQFKISDNFYEDYDYAGIAEIVFYECAANVEVTRLASGAKSIASLTNGTVTVAEGTSGAAAPVTLGGANVFAASVRTVVGGAYGGTPQIDLNGNTLAVESIDLPAGAAGLEILPGYLTCWESAYVWNQANVVRLNADEDLTIHANFTANKNGAVSLDKVGAGSLVLDGTNSCVGTLDVEEGTLCVTGGATKANMLACAANAVSVSNGGKLGFGEVSNGTKSFSLSVDGGTLAQPLPAPIIHYDFNTVSGGRVQNLGSGGSAYDGVVNGSPTTVTGVTGSALKFSANSHGVTTASEVPVRFYTFAAWVKSSGSRAQWQRIVMAGTDYAGYLGTDTAGHFTAFVRSWDNDPNDLFGNSADTENWHHVAMTYDGATMKCYLDGVLVVSKSLSHEIREYSMKLGIGNNATPNAEYWNGSIDEVYVFGHALSDGEIAILKKRSEKVNGTWIPWYGKVLVGTGGATFDTTDATASLEGVVSRSDGMLLRKTGANTLTLKGRVSGAGPVSVEGGTLTLALSAPLIHYDFDSVEDGTVPNLGTGGSAYDGVVNGSPETVDGVDGSAIKFSAEGQGVTTASEVPIRQYTFAAWVKSAGSYAQWQRIVIARTDFAGYLGTDAGGHFTAFVRSWENDPNDLFGNSADTANWHHVVMTYDGVTMKCYLDGALVVNKPLSHEIKDYSMKLGIGNNATPNNEYWNGAIDEVYVFDRAISADEVAMLKDRSWTAVNVFDPASDLSIADGATLDLGGVDQTVATLTLDGRLKRRGATTWGAVGSGAKYETPLITGSGILRVKGPGRGLVIIVK